MKGEIVERQLYLQLYSEALSGYAICKRIAVSANPVRNYELADCNPAFERIIGLSRQDMVGRQIDDLLRENPIVLNWRRLLGEMRNPGQSREEAYSKALGSWFHVDAYPLADDYYAVQFTDISAYKNQIREAERERRLLRNAIHGADIGIWEWNVQTGEHVVNERWADLIGYTLAELEPVTLETWKGLIHEEDLSVAKRRQADIFENGGRDYSLTFRMRHKDGRWIWIESRAMVTSWSPGGAPLIISGTHVDITKRKLAEDAVKENERRLIISQEIARVGNWELDLETKKMWASEEAFQIYGISWSPSGILPLEEAQARVPEEYRKTLDDALTNLIAREEKYDVEFKVINGFSKKEIYLHSKAILQKNQEGRPLKVIGTIRDKTEEMLRQNELMYLSYHDQLTGLYNRRYFNEALPRLDTQENLPITIVLCDVNGLKLINDSFGHDFGDELLKRVAEIIREGCRDSDVIFRFGGDEFALILPNTGSSDAEDLIKRIKGRIAEEKVGAFDVSVSFGYETKYRREEEIQIVSKNAEDHMYRHKLYENKSARSKTVDLIINTLYEKNNREMQHSKRVSALCESFASHIRAGKDEVSKIKIAGLMHDIGKIGIDEKILNKKERLTDSEWEEIKRHSEIGYRILGSVSEFSEIAEFVLEHQEKWDGTGYPKGLKGEDISLEARIISIADAYDAMTGVRTYGRVLQKEEALSEIERCAGSQFDPQLAKLFVEMQRSDSGFSV